MRVPQILLRALTLALPVITAAQNLYQAPILSTPPPTTSPSSQLFNLTQLSPPSITTRTQSSRTYALRLSLLHATAHSNAAGFTPMFPEIALSKDDDAVQSQRIQVPLRETCCFALNERSPEDFPTRKFGEGTLVTEIGRKGSRGTGVVALAVVREGLEVDVTADKRGEMNGEVVVVVHDRTKGEWVGSRFAVGGFVGGEVTVCGEQGVERKEMDEAEARDLWVMKAAGRRAEKVL